MKGGDGYADPRRAIVPRTPAQPGGSCSGAPEWAPQPSGSAGSGARSAFSFAGPHKNKGRWLEGRPLDHPVGALRAGLRRHGSTRRGSRSGARRTTSRSRSTTSTTPSSTRVPPPRSRRKADTTCSRTSTAGNLRGPGHQPRARSSRRSRRRSASTATLGQLSTYNPKTKKYFGVSDCYVPEPVVWRHDLWNGIGESPATWEHVRKAAPKLKAIGHPIGIGQSQELDSNMALTRVHDVLRLLRPERGQPADAQIEEDDRGRASSWPTCTRTARTDEIFGWNPASNNN